MSMQAANTSYKAGNFSSGSSHSKLSQIAHDLSAPGIGSAMTVHFAGNANASAQNNSTAAYKGRLNVLA